jgi:hypothetical protein
MMSELIITVIRQGKFNDAKNLLSQQPEAINYIEPKSGKSLLMIAISQTSKNKAELTEFVNYVLSQSHFNQINCYNSAIKKTAFDMALAEPVHPDVIHSFMSYYQRTGEVEHCLFTQAALLKGLANLPKEALKFEVAHKFYELGIKERHAGEIDEAELARLREVKNILRDFAITHAVTHNLLCILPRIEAVGDSSIAYYANGKSSLDIATPQMRAQYNELLGMASLGAATQGLFAQRTQLVAEYHNAQAQTLAAEVRDTGALVDKMVNLSITPPR